MSDKAWTKIINDYKISKHDFGKTPFLLSADQIKESCKGFRETGDREPRILCKHDKREDRPEIFRSLGVFLLPIKNGFYAIVKGEGFVDIPKINSITQIYQSKLDFILDTSSIGDSEMQHLDFAYASSLIRSFTNDPSLVLTIRGRKYTNEFDFRVGKQKINVSSVQTEVDAGYEGKNQVILIEAKNSSTNNVIIRQLYYPFRQWQSHTKKAVRTLFFERDKKNNIYNIWQFEFTDINDYNSIKLSKAGAYKINFS